MITEITTLQLPADVDLRSPESSEEEGKAIHDALSRKVREEGASFAYYGQSIEEPRTAFTVVGLGSENTQKSGSLANTSTVTTRVVRLNFHPNPDPSPALSNNHHPNLGVTEVVFLHFPADLPNKADIMASIDKMRPVAARSPEALSLFDGWSMEEEEEEEEHTTSRTNEAAATAAGEEKIQFYVNLLGWVDVEAHMRFQGSDDYKENIHHLMDIQEIRCAEMHHVKFYAV